MAGAGIGEGAHVRAGEAEDDDLVEGHDLIGLSEMQQGRHLALAALLLGDALAIIADGAGDALHLIGRQESEIAAPIVAENGHLACILHGIHRGLDGGERPFGAHLGAETAPFGQAGLVVGQGDVWLDLVEEGGRHRHIALFGEAVGDLADAVIQAEHFGKDHHRPLGRAGRVGSIGGEILGVASAQLDHGTLSWSASPRRRRAPLRANGSLMQGRCQAKIIRIKKAVPQSVLIRHNFLVKFADCRGCFRSETYKRPSSN